MTILHQSQQIWLPTPMMERRHTEKGSIAYRRVRAVLTVGSIPAQEAMTELIPVPLPAVHTRSRWW